LSAVHDDVTLVFVDIDDQKESYPFNALNVRFFFILTFGKNKEMASLDKNEQMIG
jgi:hypothetical protein